MILNKILPVGAANQLGITIFLIIATLTICNIRIMVRPGLQPMLVITAQVLGNLFFRKNCIFNTPFFR